MLLHIEISCLQYQLLIQPLKENYENLLNIMGSIQYACHQWYICADLKVVSLLTGLQTGYTKYCCFLCLWVSRATARYYVCKEWPHQKAMESGRHNVQNCPLVPKEKVLLPPLPTKLGIFKQFAKALKLKGNSIMKYLQKNSQLSLRRKSKKTFLLAHKLANWLRMMNSLKC